MGPIIVTYQICISHEIRTFDDGEGADLPERLCQTKKPKVGDCIAFYDQREKGWVDATIIQDLTKRWKFYYNIRYPDNRTDGLYLKPNTRWTFINNVNYTKERREHSTNHTELEPTPNSSAASRTDHNLGFSGSSLVQLSPTSTIQDPDISVSPSLEWDDVGTDLIQTTDPSYLDSLYDIPLDEVRNLDDLLPIPHSLSNPTVSDVRTPLNLHAVAILDSHLPISSTPCSQRRNSSVNQQFRPEPARIIPFFSNFLARLNPFKKRNQ